jgi:arylsulfatase A-like enzyme
MRSNKRREFPSINMKTIKRPGFLLGIAFSLSLLPARSDQPSSTSSEAATPNIVLIIADDLGYGDVGYYDGAKPLVPTPNIDRLAAEGIAFTDAYVTAPMCGPSRYGLLTGMYQQRLGVQDNRDCWSEIAGGDKRIPPAQKLLNQTLGSAGYVTGIVGKYNLPGYPKTTFDESMSVMHFGADYWSDETGHYVGVDELKAVSNSKQAPVWGPKKAGDEYLTDRLGRQAAEFIDRHADKPFFLYLAFNAPHSPLEAKKTHRKDVEHLPSEALRFYGAMVLALDENVGRVLAALERNGIKENTLVVFTSDNGPTLAFNAGRPDEWPKEMLGSTGPLSGRKSTLLEGGIRVPLTMTWPARWPTGRFYRQPVSTLDLYPTLCAAAGAEAPKGTVLDGVNLLPLIGEKKNGGAPRTLYWVLNDHAAIREGDWKLRTYRKQQWLTNLAEDVGEATDLTSKHPEIADRLREKLEKFRGQLPPKINPENAVNTAEN